MRDEFMAALGIRILQQLYEMAPNLYRTPTGWGRTDFSKNLRASLCNDDLSIDNTFNVNVVTFKHESTFSREAL
jgi:hypothetical protein